MSSPTNLSELVAALNWPFPSWEDLRPARDFVVEFVTENYYNAAFAVLFLLAAVYQLVRQINMIRDGRRAQASIPAPGFPSIESLPEFDWKITEPVKIRPFKPKYHLTMDSSSDPSALENLVPSDLILMDSTYLSRIEYRRSILKSPKNRPDIINIDPKSKTLVYPAIAELYTWLFSHYLPIHYPKMFKIHHAAFEYGKEVMCENRVTGHILPAKSHASDGRGITAERMLETIATNLDEDFLFLLPEDEVLGKVKPVSEQSSSSPKPDEKKPAPPDAQGIRSRKGGAAPSTPAGSATSTGAAMSTLASKASTLAADPAVSAPVVPYILSAYATAMPNGFAPSAKLGHPLRTIHEPVPNYEPVLAGSMDRFFSKIEVGKYVRRANWSMALPGKDGEPLELFAPPTEGRKMHGRKDDGEEVVEEVDGEKTFIRVERQTLHRLPQSRALIFGVHTYLYSLSEIKSEPESRDALIEAIGGLKEGNAGEGMHFYKRAGIWGDAVREYLRG